MKKIICLLCLSLLCVGAIAQQAYNVRSPYDPATQKVAEEMRGEVIKFTMADSQVYPGTEREILVYVPQQYDGITPACLLVCMDGILYDATTVMVCTMCSSRANGAMPTIMPIMPRSSKTDLI